MLSWAPLHAQNNPPIAIPKPVASEDELARCPRDAEQLGGRPDAELYTYIGFRYVRADGSTCDAQPSGRTIFREAAQMRASYQADPAGDAASYSYDLATPEYQIVRQFFFRTHLDGSRRLYFFDQRVYNGVKVPERVRLEFVNREAYPLLPWEAGESFAVTYGDPAGATLAVLSALYEYDVAPALGRTPEGHLETTFRLTAKRKKELKAPDPAGLELSLSVVQRGKDYFLLAQLSDKWQRYYNGAKTGLKIGILRVKAGRGDDVRVYDINLEVDPFSAFAIDISDPRWEPFRRAPLTRQRDYYVDWSFRRAGSRLSSDAWVGKGRTPKVYLGEPDNGGSPFPGD